MNFIGSVLIIVMLSSFGVRSEPITLMALLGGTAVAAAVTVKAGGHCPVLCTRKLCSTGEDLTIPQDFKNEFEKKTSGFFDKFIGSNHGIAHFCAATCNKGKEQVRIGTVNIEVKKLYNRFTSLKNCMTGYNETLPSSSTRSNPSKSISVFSEDELQQVKKFSATNDLDGYFLWTQGKENLQPNAQWELWDLVRESY